MDLHNQRFRDIVGCHIFFGILKNNKMWQLPSPWNVQLWNRISDCTSNKHYELNAVSVCMSWFFGTSYTIVIKLKDEFSWNDFSIRKLWHMMILENSTNRQLTRRVTLPLITDWRAEFLVIFYVAEIRSF